MVYDVLVLGAGAAGLMCAATAGQRGRKVLVLDHAKRPGRKILISGGGRCNFTNYHITQAAYLSTNPHFAKSALSRYTQYDFIDLVERYGIAYHEKTQGQLFCDNSAKDIVQMLLSECEMGQVQLAMEHEILKVDVLPNGHYRVQTAQGNYEAYSLVVATGGCSMPRLGATAFAYQIATSFGLSIQPPRAALVPLTLHPDDKRLAEALSGVSLPVSIQAEYQSFTDDMLFTHRGLSGPAVLQISSYWLPGQPLSIDLLPQHNLTEWLHQQQSQHMDKSLKTLLSFLLPKRAVEVILANDPVMNLRLRQLSAQQLEALCLRLHQWQLQPAGTEGYRTAEVTLGGVCTRDLSSKTMMSVKQPNLYFIGEAVDVTGWLGGFNFQWAWSSGWAAGQVV